MSNCKTIAICNQKGGVGKTTTTVNLGVGLAMQGKTVLLIDADPQGDLTTCLGWKDTDNLGITLATKLTDVINETMNDPTVGILHHDEGVDLVPANLELSAMEFNLVNAMSRETALRNYLSEVKDKYDYILIDCMPSLGMVTINALSAADSVIIPVQAQYLPAKGMTQLVQTISRVKKRINPGLKIDGKLKYFAGDLQREIRYPVSEMQESLWKKNLSLARGAFLAEEVDDFYHTLRLGELPHGTCLSYRTGSQRECLLAAFDSNKKIVLVKKDETVVARACLRLTKGAFQKPPAIDFSFADLSQENTATGKSAAGEKAVLFLESVYTSRLNDIEKEEVMKLAVSLTTQKAAELGVVAVLARRYLGCYERDEYVLAPFYVYISKSKNGWQYLDSLGGAAYTSAKEEYVERPFLVMQTAMHQAEVNSRNEVEYE